MILFTGQSGKGVYNYTTAGLLPGNYFLKAKKDLQMDYNEAIQWVHSLGRFAGRPGLERMRRLLHQLGNPHQKLKFVHVVGTNGKGSAVMMTASILKEAGYKTGANISPYVLDFRERFLINGEMISEDELAEVLTCVEAAARQLPEPPLEFEAVTAAALFYFAKEACDIVCLEAGMGGGHDYTNVIENTELVYVMRIGFDHTEILGHTLPEIAKEKCGVFKNNCPVISYPEQPAEAERQILESATKAECPLTIPAAEDITYYKTRRLENRVNYGGYELAVPFLGRHQALNAAVVVEGALALWRKGYAIEDEHIINGIEKAKFPARIEIISHSPLVIIDGAHNEDSAKALAATLCATKLEGLTAVVGLLEDKQAEKIVAMLAPYIRTLYVVAPASPRALAAEKLADIARPLVKRTFVCDDVETALELAKEEETGLLVFGSLYLASEARKLLMPQE